MSNGDPKKNKLVFGDVRDKRLRPELALAIKEILELIDGDIFVTSASRLSRKKGGSPHTHAGAIDFRLKDGANPELYMFLFGVENPMDYEMSELKLTPQAEELFKKHNLRLIDERNRHKPNNPGELWPHFHLDVNTQDGEHNWNGMGTVYELGEDATEA